MYHLMVVTRLSSQMYLILRAERCDRLPLALSSDDTYAVTRNKRGEIIGITSGATASKIFVESYSYSPNQVGQMTSINFFPANKNTWQQSFGYDNAGFLTSYSTNVRPSMDTYKFTYDRVGNRTSENYNGATPNLVNYQSDQSGNTKSAEFLELLNILTAA